MIKESFLKKQINKSKREGKTSHFLKKLVFMVVDQALKDHYGNDRSMKCFQSSLVIQMVLEKIQIESTIIQGAVCVPKVFENSKQFGWEGFWGDDYHIWLQTEFYEWVDLTIHYLPLHPSNQHNNALLAMPSIWWEDATKSPRIIKYMQELGTIHVLEESSLNDLEEFKKITNTYFYKVLDTYTVQQIEFAPVLHDLYSMEKLYEKQEPWALKTLEFEKLEFPHPPWIQEREKELFAEYIKLQKKL